MRILFVAPYPPSRIRIRAYGFVSHLAKQHEVTVLALCSSKREALDAQALQDAGFAVIAVQDRHIWKILRVLRALFTKLPLQVAFDASPRLRAVISEQLALGSFDLMHVEFIRVLGALPENFPVPLVWDAVDCISLLYEQGGRAGTTVLLRLLGTFEARRVRMYEREQLSGIRQVLVASPRDQNAFLEIAAPPSTMQVPAVISVLPHGIDQNYFRPALEERWPETLIFSGKMSFHANVAGVLHLAKQIMPLIWQKKPGVRLIIAGSNPPASVRRLAQHRLIEVTGYVPDIRPYIERAQVAVCPLPYAVGIQNKILEAMALETPVVASPQAAAGLLGVAGRDLLIAAEPQAFADAVLRLLDDRQLHREIAANGSKYIATYHNWDRLIQQLISIYTDTIASV
ncbi:MAG: glycosyltransferase [Chloroflexota bacterium]|nr:glycosyltransferase [Chloroflexota bacterium]